MPISNDLAFANGTPDAEDTLAAGARVRIHVTATATNGGNNAEPHVLMRINSKSGKIHKDELILGPNYRFVGLNVNVDGFVKPGAGRHTVTVFVWDKGNAPTALNQIRIVQRRFRVRKEKA